MKKRIFVAAALSAVVIGAFAGCGNNADIGRDAALEAALNDAGVSESDTTRLTVSEDRDDGRKVYDVKFDAAGKEYDYEIQASDGKILSSDIENIDDYAVSQESSGGNAADGQGTQSSGQSGTATQGSTSGQTDDSTVSQSTQQGSTADDTGSHHSGNNADVAVSQEQAIQIALERVSGATEQDIRIELDYDDGRYKYEGEIRYNNREYDFEIDANTGTILEWSEERD